MILNSVKLGEYKNMKCFYVVTDGKSLGRYTNGVNLFSTKKKADRLANSLNNTKGFQKLAKILSGQHWYVKVLHLGDS